MAISVDRIRADIEAIARCTSTPGNGATRPTFSAAWEAARLYVMSQAASAGCKTMNDRGGNLHARPAELDWDAPAWLIGSHVDTVPHGGDYDGVAGVVVALELLRSAREDAIAAPPIELVEFAEEEGPTFGLGMIGSRTWVGELAPVRLTELRNAAGQTYAEAGVAHGVNEPGAPAPSDAPGRYRGLIEVHIEQGPGLWRRGQRLAVVSAIAGRRQYRVTVHGEANHAGATSMADRKDALVGAAELLTALEGAVKQLDPRAVLTVGRLDVQPNAVNVIADRVQFTVDFRAPDDELLRRGHAMVGAVIDAIAAERGLRVEREPSESIPARPMDARLVERLARAGGGLPVTVSGALHDSAVLAPHLPTVMLFVPSRDGISHNPAEFSRVEDIAEAARVVERMIRRPGIGQLNSGSRDAFVSLCGGFFEHSPWVAERAWERRPFSSVSDLHEKMCAAVRHASTDERLGLIRAHPDLVGRLAKEGRLTRESTREQAAAGLTSLSEAEAAAFERYNAAYRERFGFPFVICARENRKDAILAAFPPRLANSYDVEVAAALREIEKIARLRTEDAILEE